MTLDKTISLLHIILSELPTAIRTGSELIALINEAFARLTNNAKDVEIAKSEIDDLVKQIIATSDRIQRL